MAGCFITLVAMETTKIHIGQYNNLPPNHPTRLLSDPNFSHASPSHPISLYVRAFAFSASKAPYTRKCEVVAGMAGGSEEKVGILSRINNISSKFDIILRSYTYLFLSKYT